jgi:hypothetical protein
MTILLRESQKCLRLSSESSSQKHLPTRGLWFLFLPVIALSRLPFYIIYFTFAWSKNICPFALKFWI